MLCSEYRSGLDNELYCLIYRILALQNMFEWVVKEVTLLEPHNYIKRVTVVQREIAIEQHILRFLRNAQMCEIS